MFHVLTIIGARPQIIKAAALSRSIKTHYSDLIEEKILHTGQHYDANMSQVFFEELHIPQPDYNLHVGSGLHGAQTAKMIEGIEQVLLSSHFDALVVYGDTNSTLAGALAASKLHIPVIHIEAGLRSYNMAMPEEQNRILCDQLSNMLFTPTQTAMENLRREGFFDGKMHMANHKARCIYNSGDIMYDNSLYFAQEAERKTDFISQNKLNNYVLVTIHRDNNTDDSQRLSSIFSALLEISKEKQVILPLHPRTRKLLQTNLSENLFDEIKKSNIRIIPPVSFLEMTLLERHAAIIITDSGGVQKEAFFFKKPCIIVRSETEWVEILEHGAGLLADADTQQLIRSYHQLINKQISFDPIFGDGHAADFIVEKIITYLS